MLVFLLALAGIVTVASTAVAWICDSLTKEQQERHDELRRTRDAMQAEFMDEQHGNAQRSAQDLRDHALRTKAFLAGNCRSYLEAKTPLDRDLPALRLNLQQQLKQEHLSPFKRNALQMLLTKLEDALHRLHAYQAYCAWYVARLDAMEQSRQYAQLIDFDVPEPKLPPDWFYVGKVGIVERDELNVRANRFGQVLQLAQVREADGFAADPLELILAQSYPDQEGIPVQLVRMNKSAVFFSASVLRGALHVDHIRDRVPCKAIVERVQNGQHQGYQVRCYPATYSSPRGSTLLGGVTARLARSEARYPGKTYQPGDVLEVFPLHYDVLLSDRRARDPQMMTVTERVESLNFEQESAAPVYLCVANGQPKLAELATELEGDAEWQLTACHELEPGRYQIDFQLGAWLVRTTSDAADDFLAVHEIEAADVHSLERTSLPFELQLIERSYLGDVFIDAQQYRQLRHFCQQQQVYEQRVAERERAWEFFTRWNKVADYLLDVDGHLTALLALEEAAEGLLVVSCDSESEHQMKSLAAQVEADLQKGRRSRLALELAYLDGTGAQVWLQVAELAATPPKVAGRYEIEIGAGGQRAMELGRFGFKPVAPAELRLRARKGGDYQNLIRQKGALEAFVLDKLVNKSIKQILVDPAGYAGQPSLHWEEKVAAGLAWHNPKWQAADSATSSKRVIEQALVESNLYLIQGPPGTGKTTSIVEMLHQLYRDNPELRILVVSQQNAAVDNALTRFLSEAPQFADRILRVGAQGKMDESLRAYGSDARLQAYYEGRVAAFQRAVAMQGSAPPLLRDWIGSIRDEEQRFDPELSEMLIGEYKLVGATCVGLATQRHGMHRLQFDVAIIDEAGRSTVPEMLIPILRARKVILIGDHFQLPPSIAATLREEESAVAFPFLEETFLKESFFEVMYRSLPSVCRGRLDQQFRMVEPIGDLVADLFYQAEGKRGLFNGLVHDRTDFLDPDVAIRWHDVCGQQETEGTSKLNRAEAEAIVAYLTAAAERLNKRGAHKHVAIITPYGAQKRLIRRLIDKVVGASGEDQDTRMLGGSLAIRVDTVDSFQGSEADIVLYSTVRTVGDISFIRDRQRLNVSCSRARENLVFFGDSAFLKRAEGRLRSPEQATLFGEIIQRSVVEVTAFTVQVQHVPKIDSPFLFAQRGTARYFVHSRAAKNTSWREWCALKVGDTLEITLSDQHAGEGKYQEATTAKVLARRDVKGAGTQERPAKHPASIGGRR